MIVIPGNAQAVGERQEQQDAFGFTDKDDAAFVAHGGVLAVVADGMGGMALGQQAGQCAVNTLLETYAEKLPEENISEALMRALHGANTAVVKLAEEAGLTGEVGTTVVAAVIHQGQLYWVSVGDSHLYLYRQGTLKQLTTDHIYAAELAKAVSGGELSQAEAEQHPERQSLTSYVGLAPLTVIDANTIQLAIGDRLLLCSDGLYGGLSKAEMAAELAGDPHRAAETLIRQALVKRHARQDNLTAVVMAWETEGWIEPQQLKQQADIPKTRMASRIGIGVAILLAWMTGFVMGRYWETARRAMTNTEQKGEASRTFSSPQEEKLSSTTPEKKVPKEGTSNE